MLNRLLTQFPTHSAALILVYFLVMGAIVTNFVFPTPALAQGPAPDAACKKCHTSTDAEITYSSGETLAAKVDVDTLAQSTHGPQSGQDIFCTDCHSPASYQYPHPPNPAQTPQEFAAGVSENCQHCHESIQKHNPGHLMAKNTENLPTCTDCHGSGHNVKSARTLSDDPVATCQQCHKTFEDPKMDAVHQELAANLGPDQNCETCHTGAPTYPADEQCKACHGILQSEMTLESGDKISLHVDAEVVEGSVHGTYQTDEYHYTALLCTDCHKDQGRYGFPHEPVTPPNERLFTLEMSGLCKECHQDIYDKQQDSTHAHALAEGKIEAADCADCHGSHDIQPPNKPRGRISQTCSQCHATINMEYEESVHGAALLGEDNPDVPVCIDCHGVHNIEDPTTALFRVRSPKLCGDCHADEALMGKYDISTDVFDTYVADFHGTTVELFEKQSPDHETNKAVCYDCHGVHNILPASDEHSQVIKENLTETCRQCHPDANANFSDSWTSHFEPSLEHNTLIYLINLFYTIVIPLTISGLVFFIITDIVRRLINRWRGPRSDHHDPA